MHHLEASMTILSSFLPVLDRLELGQQEFRRLLRTISLESLHRIHDAHGNGEGRHPETSIQNGSTG